MTHRSHSFSLPIHVIEDLRRLAEAREESMSFVIREALRAYFREQLGDRPWPQTTRCPTEGHPPARPKCGQ